MLKKASIDSLTVLSQTIESKDPYARGHCLRVRNFSKELGKAFKQEKQKNIFLEFSSLLHDIGKIGIPGIILNKNGK